MKLSEKLAAFDEAPPRPRPRPEAAEPTESEEPRPTSVPRRLSDATEVAGPTPRSKRASASWEEAKRRVRELVLADLGPKLTAVTSRPGEALEKEVKAALDRILQREDVRISPIERRKFVAEVMSDTLGYGPLDGLLADPSVTEIMCNGHEHIWVERAGVIEPTDLVFSDEAQLRHVIDKIVSAVGRRVDESSPMVDARLPDGSRVNAVVPPLAIDGAVLTIRKFADDPYTVADLIRFGALTMDLAVFLEACVRGKLNILISGGTGTGKTTNLNVLSSFIPAKERIVTIEDAAELQLQQPHVVRLESRPPSAEGSGEVKIRDLVRNALRMRPDRIVVGEVRGAEALDMLQAMNTGHAGSLTTVHANTPRDALSRIETMVLMAGFDLPIRAIREQVASAINLIVQLERASDGARRIVSVQEVQGLEGDVILLQELFTFRSRLSPDGGRQIGEVEATGLRPRLMDQIINSGIELPASVFRAPARVDPAVRTARSLPTAAELLASRGKR